MVVKFTFNLRFRLLQLIVGDRFFSHNAGSFHAQIRPKYSKRSEIRLEGFRRLLAQVIASSAIVLFNADVVCDRERPLLVTKAGMFCNCDFAWKM